MNRRELLRLGSLAVPTIVVAKRLVTPEDTKNRYWNWPDGEHYTFDIKYPSDAPDWFLRGCAFGIPMSGIAPADPTKPMFMDNVKLARLSDPTGDTFGHRIYWGRP